MSLTKTDLQAIKTIIDYAIEGSEGRMSKAIEGSKQHTTKVVEDAIEESKQHTAAGFAEVHEKIDNLDTKLSDKIQAVDDKLTVKAGKLENTVQRVDGHDIEIKKIKRKLSLA